MGEVQGLLEIMDAHHPEDLEIPLHSFILTLILAHKITGKEAPRRSNL